MVRLWSGSSAPDRGEKSRSREFLHFACAFGLALQGVTELPFMAGAHASEQPSAKISAESPRVYEVERLDHLKPSERPRVGDRLVMRIRGVPADAQWGWLDRDLNAQESGWEGVEKQSGIGSAGEFQFSVIPIRPGQLTLPPMLLKDQAGHELARSSPLLVEVVSAISPQDPQPDQPNDLEPPVGLQFPWFWVASLSVVIIALFVAAGLGLWRWRKQRRAPEKIASEPILPEDQVALSRLLELEQKNYSAQREYKKHYFGISEILKAYVGSRFRIDAREATTREMVLALTELKGLDGSLISGVSQGIGVSEAQIGDLKKLFTILDRVKFTDFQPDGVESVQVLEEARKWVQNTRRKAEVSPAPESSPAGEMVENAIR